MVSSRDIASLTGWGAKERWNGFGDLGTPTVVTYSFGSGPPPYQLWPFFAMPYTNYRGWSEEHKIHARAALDEWAATSGLVFVEVPDRLIGELRFSFVSFSTQQTPQGVPYTGIGYKAPQAEAFSTRDSYDGYAHARSYGDMFFRQEVYAKNPSLMDVGQRGYRTLLHEIGHSLGLKHPHDPGPRLDPGRDDSLYTIMSYRNTSAATGLGPLDVATAQFLYGQPESSIRAFWSEKREMLVQIGKRGGDELSGSHLDDLIRGFRGNDRITTYAGDDVVLGGDQRDVIITGTGSDVGKGGNGRDTIVLGAGHDRAIGGKGPDLLFGGEGKDVLRGGDGRDTLNCGDGDDLAKGGDGRDRIELGPGADVGKGGRGDDRLFGGAGADQANGDAGDDTIKGDEGDDTLRGGAGDDRLLGDSGADLILGGAGDDTLGGGDGNDVLRGGAGSDSFLFDSFAGLDVVADFDVRFDHILFALDGDYADSVEVSQVGADVEIEIFRSTMRIENASLEEVMADGVLIF